MPDLPDHGGGALIEAGGGWVFAYGSNMHLPDLERWTLSRGLAAPRVGCARVATLHGFELVWNYRSPSRLGGAANVAPRPGGGGRGVPGVALHVDGPTLRSLDLKEGHPDRYTRGPAPRAVELVAGGVVQAWVYEVTDAWRLPEMVPPRPDYLNLLIEGARRFGLPEWHLRSLEATPTTPAA